jgi:hypothetical protein
MRCNTKWEPSMLLCVLTLRLLDGESILLCDDVLCLIDVTAKLMVVGMNRIGGRPRLLCANQICHDSLTADQVREFSIVSTSVESGTVRIRVDALSTIALQLSIWACACTCFNCSTTTCHSDISSKCGKTAYHWDQPLFSWEVAIEVKFWSNSYTLPNHQSFNHILVPDNVVEMHFCRPPVLLFEFNQVIPYKCGADENPITIKPGV